MSQENSTPTDILIYNISHTQTKNGKEESSDTNILMSVVQQFTTKNQKLYLKNISGGLINMQGLSLFINKRQETVHLRLLMYMKSNIHGQRHRNHYKVRIRKEPHTTIHLAVMTKIHYQNLVIKNKLIMVNMSRRVLMMKIINRRILVK